VGYRTSLFFQYLGNSGLSDQDIHALVTLQQFTTTLEQERARVAQDEQIKDAFPKFAAHFRDTSITFHDNTPIATIKSLVADDYLELDLPAEGIT